jgi:type I restriction enzyme S subunit
MIDGLENKHREYRRVRLGDHFIIKKGSKIEQKYVKEKNDIRFLQIDDLRNDNNLKFCSDNGKYCIAKENDIILAWDGANAGTCSYGLRGALGSTLAILICNSKDLFIPYVGKFMQSKFYILRNTCTGATIPHLNRNILLNLEIPLPPIEEQMKIAKTLDMMSELIEKRKEQLSLFDELIRNTFLEMFGDPATNTKRWEKKEFTSVAKIDTYMTSDFKKYSDYPHIGIESIEKNTGKILQYDFIKNCNLKSGKYLFDERHIIYSKIRPKLNKVALPNFKGLCSADAYPILPNDLCTRAYLAYILRSDYFLDYIIAHSDRTNIPKVNKNQLEGFVLPFPELELQNKFSNFVAQVEKQKTIMQQSLEKLEINNMTLMQKYFN